MEEPKMARTKKTEPAKDADKKGKATPKGTEAPEQAQDTPKEQTQGATQEQGTAEQTENADQEKETPEQTQDTTQEQETAEKEEDPEQEPQETSQDAPEAEGDTNTAGSGDAPQGPQNEPERDIFADIPNPCVYCGPTVRGVARQYTTYQGGIPDELRNFIKEHPQARELIVSTGRFASFRKRLDTPGTAEANLYKQVKGLL